SINPQSGLNDRNEQLSPVSSWIQLLGSWEEAHLTTIIGSTTGSCTLRTPGPWPNLYFENVLQENFKQFFLVFQVCLPYQVMQRKQLRARRRWFVINTTKVLEMTMSKR
ncbi:hypothetical protein H5410_031456, partial [Solanum commersonii]